MSIQRTAGWDREVTLVSQLAAAASLFSFLFYFRHGDLLLYGDAVAHINIARRVIDSRTPGLLQLGTVWLPLPHLCIIPFLFSNAAWQTGIGGSIPSMCAYVLGTAGVFLLVRSALSSDGQPDFAGRAAAWLAALIFAANPNLLYMQTTAMTEVLYLAFFIWSLVHFSRFARSAVSRGSTFEDAAGSANSLIKCGWCVLGACLTRYDGWFLSGILCLATTAVVIVSKPTKVRLNLAKFVLLAVTGPLIWLAYNAIIYRNSLEFANGPYSARAIEQRKTALSASSPHPGWHNLSVSFSYFLKAAEDNIAEGRLQKFWVGSLVIALIIIIALRRNLWPLLLVGVPIVFYTLSVAYGSVPVYLPNWWPFGYYNVRFGLELLPGFAVAIAVIMYFFWVRIPQRSVQAAIFLCALVVAGVSYGGVWKAQPICYREAWINSRSRIALDNALASNLLKLPHDSSLLMYLGDHVGALQEAGIPLRRTINEGNHRPWKTPSDPEGLWERALADPRKLADYAITIDEDAVATHVQHRDLTSVIVIQTGGQSPATIYWTHREAGNQAR